MNARAALVSRKTVRTAEGVQLERALLDKRATCAVLLERQGELAREVEDLQTRLAKLEALRPVVTVRAGLKALIHQGGLGG